MEKTRGKEKSPFLQIKSLLMLRLKRRNRKRIWVK